jgi:hypothetical protein
VDEAMTGGSVSFAAWGRIGRHEKVGYLRRKFRVESDKQMGEMARYPVTGSQQLGQDNNVKTYVSIITFA